MTIEQAKEVLKQLPDGCCEEELKIFAETLTKVVVIKTSWYPEVLQGLEQSSLEYLASMGVRPEAIEVLQVPGCVEMPLAMKWAAKYKKADAIVALGCVVQGETPHFDFVCQGLTAGLTKVQLKYSDCPIGFGVLTVANMAQAQARLAKGAEAAQAALVMKYTYHKLKVKDL